MWYGTTFVIIFTFTNVIIVWAGSLVFVDNVCHLVLWWLSAAGLGPRCWLGRTRLILGFGEYVGCVSVVPRGQCTWGCSVH